MRKLILIFTILLLSFSGNAVIGQAGIITILGDTLIGEARIANKDFILFSIKGKKLMFQKSFIAKTFEIDPSNPHSINKWKEIDLEQFIAILKSKPSEENIDSEIPILIDVSTDSLFKTDYY